MRIEGTAKSPIWQDADNPRFGIYDSDTPVDEEDGLVLDKETSPSGRGYRMPQRDFGPMPVPIAYNWL